MRPLGAQPPRQLQFGAHQAFRAKLGAHADRTGVLGEALLKYEKARIVDQKPFSVRAFAVLKWVFSALSAGFFRGCQSLCNFLGSGLWELSLASELCGLNFLLQLPST